MKIGEGMVSEAFLNESRVLLVGKRPDAFKIYTELKTTLDFFDGKIKSLKIPAKAKLIEPNEKYPLGAITFLYVPGTPLNERIDICSIGQKVSIGKKLAEFIAELQSIKLNDTYNKEKEIERNCTKFENSLVRIEPYLKYSENEKLRLIAADYRSFLESSNFYMTHGDLHFENLIVDQSNKLVGIIDFGNTEYYVPETEFMWMQDADPVIFNAMLQSLGNSFDPNKIKLVRLVGAVRFFKHVIGIYKDMKEKQLEIISTLLTEYKLND